MTTFKLRFIWLITLVFSMVLPMLGVTIGFDNYTIAPGETKTLIMSIKAGSISFVGFQADIATPQDLMVTNIAFAPEFGYTDDYTLTSNLSNPNKASFIIFARDINKVPKEVTGPFLAVTVQLSENPKPQSELITISGIKASDSNGQHVEGNITPADPVGSVVIPVMSIQLSETTWGCEVDDEKQLTATILPENATDKSVEWTSSNISVATVDQTGKVKAVGVGNTQITVTSKADNGVSAVCSFKVATKVIPVSSVTVTPETWVGKVGESTTLIATTQPEEATNKALNWTSSKVSVATVDEKGNVTAINVGEATITVTAVDGSGVSASCKVTVVPTKVAKITLSTNEWSGTVGEKTQLTVTVTPDDATNKDVKWTSSNTAVATVDAKGNVTAVNVGTAVITVTATDGSDVKAECKVTVMPILVNEIILSENMWGLVVGESFKLTATVRPTNATDKVLLWSSSDPAVVTVDNNGTVTAIAEGEAVITATAADGSGVTAECHVTVDTNVITVESLSLNASEWSGKAGESTQLTATVLPADATNKAVKWTSSNTAIATVDNRGKVTAVSVGTAVITAATTDGSALSATCRVTVVPTPVSAITLSASEWSGIAGDITQLTATVVPDDATDKTLTWTSSNDAVATVDANGNVTTVSVGTAVITVTATDGSGVKADCKVTVKPVLVTSIEISEHTWGCVIGESFKLTVSVKPDNATDKDVIWSTSNPAVATVDAVGNVTAVSEGEAVITATAADGSGVSAECLVTVDLNIVLTQTITLSNSKWEANAGETLKLTATVLPVDATNRAVKWMSNDPKIATVDAQGLVTAIAVGEAIITATAADGSGATASCQVTVVPTSVTAIELSASEWSGIAGDMTKLTATVVPENATDKTLTWTSSNDAVATVDANGNVTAVSVGTAVITATAADGSGVSAECKVTVKPVLATSIQISEHTWGCIVGETFTLIATVNPANVTDNTVIWSTSDEIVATVDAEGNVTAVGVGEAIITATAADGSGIKAECVVTVGSDIVTVETITLNETEWATKAGDTLKLTATVLPVDATNKAVKWTSSDPKIATVDAQGLVTAIAVGEAVITATAADGSGAAASCKVTVEPTLVEWLMIEPENWYCQAGETFWIIATVLPEDATDMTLIWSSTNEEVATVDSNGEVTAISNGTCVIEVATQDGSDLKAECWLTVSPKVDVDMITGDASKVDVYTVDGVMLRRDCDNEALKQLAPGLYILHGKGKVAKVYLNGK